MTLIGLPWASRITSPRYSAQVSLSGGRRRHGQQPRAADAASYAFEIAEEKDSVFNYGTADGAAELIAQHVSGIICRWSGFFEIGRVGCGACSASLWRKRKAAPCRSFVPDLVETDTTPAMGLAEFGVVILRGDLGLADGLDVGIDDDQAEERVAVLGPV